jgi:hypothetical protein
MKDEEDIDLYGKWKCKGCGELFDILELCMMPDGAWHWTWGHNGSWCGPVIRPSKQKDEKTKIT